MKKHESIVYTNEDCIGCNRCISACPVLIANQAVEEDGCQKVIVNEVKCTPLSRHFF